MKTSIVTILAAALLAAASAAAYAQNTAPDQEKGSTGWSGGAKDQATQNGQKVEVHDEAKAKDQPAIATGGDLKGPPQQLAPSKTPE